LNTHDPVPKLLQFQNCHIFSVTYLAKPNLQSYGEVKGSDYHDFAEPIVLSSVPVVHPNPTGNFVVYPVDREAPLNLKQV
jgi:hypothetical protein